MKVANWFVVGVVELGDGTTKSMEWSTANQKHESKPGTRFDHDEHKLNKATENKNCGSNGYRTAESV
jgi:hypothetical protein